MVLLYLGTSEAISKATQLLDTSQNSPGKALLDFTADAIARNLIVVDLGISTPILEVGTAAIRAKTFIQRDMNLEWMDDRRKANIKREVP